jgi:hypothetical protein
MPNSTLASNKVFGEGEKLANSTNSMEPTKVANAKATKELAVHQPSEWPLKDDEETYMHGQHMQDEIPQFDSFESNFEIVLCDLENVADETLRKRSTSPTSLIKKKFEGKKKVKQYKMLKVSLAITDKKYFKTMHQVDMVTGREEKEPANTNAIKTEVAASQLKIVPPDAKVNKGKEEEPADQDVTKSSMIVATSELTSDAVRKLSPTNSSSSMQRQLWNDALFWSQPPSWLSSDILNAPMDKF